MYSSHGRVQTLNFPALPPVRAQGKDGKFNTQLTQIERLLKDKGHDHEGAFKKPVAPVKAGGEPGGYDPALTPARGKRQRI